MTADDQPQSEGQATAELGYEPNRYWESLLSDSFDSSGVAYAYLAVSFNDARYRAEQDVVRRALERHPSPVRTSRVGPRHRVRYGHLDRLLARPRHLGDHRRGPHGGRDRSSGEGRRAGALGARRHRRSRPRPRAPVRHHLRDECTASHRRPRSSFLGRRQPRAPPRPGRPARADRAGHHARLVGRRARRQGQLTRADPGLLDAEFERHGLELLEVRPVTFLLANPIDARSSRIYQLWLRYWNYVLRFIGRRERVGAVAGRLLEWIDRPLRRSRLGGPSAKMMIVRHRDESPRSPGP